MLFQKSLLYEAVFEKLVTQFIIQYVAVAHNCSVLVRPRVSQYIVGPRPFSTPIFSVDKLRHKWDSRILEVSTVISSGATSVNLKCFGAACYCLNFSVRRYNVHFSIVEQYSRVSLRRAGVLDKVRNHLIEQAWMTGGVWRVTVWREVKVRVELKLETNRIQSEKAVP